MNAETDPQRRAVELERVALGRYVARNANGIELTFGHGDDLFSPVELLLAAVGGCSAIDVDYVTSKRAEPSTLRVRIDGAKITDEGGGHRLGDVHVDFTVEFADDEAGRAAAAVVERTVRQSRDRLCTVSRTVAHETPVTYSIDDQPLEQN